MWLLEADGTFVDETRIDFGREVAAEAFDKVLPEDTAITLRFSSTADGRGFSVARQLRADGYAGWLYAAGPLIPDQARHAFQSGFDGVVITEEQLEHHGELSWRNALANAVSELYVAGSSTRGPERGLWAARHLRRAP